MTEWIRDDPSVADDAWLYRRIRRVPDHYVPRDPVTGQPIVTLAALRYVNDGMSVYESDAMNANGITSDDLHVPETHTLAKFTAVRPRTADGGVVRSHDPHDEITARGDCHALVRSSAPPPDKIAWHRIRLAIRQELLVRDGPSWLRVGE